MCGVAGWISAEARSDDRALADAAALIEPIRNRGPDSSGFKLALGNRVGFVTTRLAIIDPVERSNQPLVDPASNAFITFNGEIYNYPELRRALVEAGVGFGTTSDTEVVLKGYLKEGVSFFAKLRGMYAFAIFDPRNSRVVAFRDHFGIKPIYFGGDARTVVFSSSPSSVASTIGRPELEPAAAVSVAVLGSVLEPLSKWKNVAAVASGVAHIWTISDGAVRLARECVAPSFPWQADKAAADPQGTLRDSFVDSIRAHFTSDVPVGVFQSGGLDSSLISACAKHLGFRPTLLTLGFEELKGTELDEVGDAAQVAKALGFEHRYHYVGRDEFGALEDTFFARMESPTADAINTALISSLCQREGFKVALSGVGGDEIFGSYPSFRQLPLLARAGRYVPAPVLRELLSVGVRGAARFRADLSPKLRYLPQYLAPFSRSYLLRRCYFAPEELPDVLAPEIIREGEPRFWSAYEEAASRATGAGLAAVRTLERDVYMRNTLLKDADWAGMAFSVEIRVPFVDVPFYRRICAPNGDSTFKKADLGRLFATLASPLQALRRPKRGFLIPYETWSGVTAGKSAPADARHSVSAGTRQWNKHVLKRCFGDWALS